MKRLLLLILACTPLMVSAQVGNAGQIAVLYHRYAPAFFPGTITYHSGKTEDYMWIELPKIQQSELTVATDKNRRKKKTVYAKDIRCITYRLDLNSEASSTLYPILTDRTGKGKKLKYYWGYPKWGSPWGVVFICHPTYSMGDDGELMGDYYVTVSSNGMRNEQTIPCVLVRQGRKNGFVIGYKTSALDFMLYWNAFHRRAVAEEFALVPALKEGILKKAINGAALPFMLDEMALAMRLETGKIDSLESTMRPGECIVHPVYAETDKRQLRAFAFWFANRFFPDEARQMHSYRLPEYEGIGHIITYGDGYCVQTTRDVIGYAETADVTFVLPERSVTIDNCEVLGSNDIDEAFIRLSPDDERVQYLVQTPEIAATLNNKEPLPLSEQTNDRALFLQLCKLSPDDWTTLYRQLPDSVREDFYDMPLDVLRDVALGNAEHNLVEDKHTGQLKAKTHAGLVNDIDNASFVAYYDNFISRTNMVQGICLELAPGRKHRIGLFGFGVGCLLQDMHLEDAYTAKDYGIKPLPALLFSAYGGVQFPCRVATNHVLLPRMTIGANGGPVFNWWGRGVKSNKERLVTGTGIFVADARVGAEYRYETKRYTFLFGVHYTFMFLGTGAELNMPTASGAPHKTSSFNPYIQHGIGIRTGVAF